MKNLRNTFNWIKIPIIDFTIAKKFYISLLDFERHEFQMGLNK
jgi:predicted enzyme related to lactoylglutathione lyase